MKRYIAFLRGININGKNKINMVELKAELETAGYMSVSTFLNSGNVSFVTSEGDVGKTMEEMIQKRFGLEVPVYVIEYESLKKILLNSPAWWNTGSKDKYDNLIFILSSDTPEKICEMLGEPSDGMERIQIYRNVIFWTFDRKQYQKCNWWKKTASAGIADKLTIRTASTVLKICK